MKSNVNNMNNSHVNSNTKRNDLKKLMWRTIMLQLKQQQNNKGPSYIMKRRNEWRKNNMNKTSWRGRIKDQNINQAKNHEKVGQVMQKVVAQRCEHWEPWKGTSLPLTLLMMDNTCHDGVNPLWKKVNSHHFLKP